MGILKEIEQKYVDGKLVETYITIRTDGKNSFFHFLGLIPDNLLGKPVDFEEHITKEDKQYYYVSQTIMNLKSVPFRVGSGLPSSDISLEWQYLIKAEGKIAK